MVVKAIQNGGRDNPGALCARKLSVEVVLDELFKMALGCFEKKELDELNMEALELFEECEAYIKKTKKFPLNQMQNKIFKALD